MSKLTHIYDTIRIKNTQVCAMVVSYSVTIHDLREQFLLIGRNIRLQSSLKSEM